MDSPCRWPHQPRRRLSRRSIPIAVGLATFHGPRPHHSGPGRRSPGCQGRNLVECTQNLGNTHPSGRLARTSSGGVRSHQTGQNRAGRSKTSAIVRPRLVFQTPVKERGLLGPKSRTSGSQGNGDSGIGGTSLAHPHGTIISGTAWTTGVVIWAFGARRIPFCRMRSTQDCLVRWTNRIAGSGERTDFPLRLLASRSRFLTAKTEILRRHRFCNPTAPLAVWPANPAWVRLHTCRPGTPPARHLQILPSI
jgi:hypothetical protein